MVFHAAVLKHMTRPDGLEGMQPVFRRAHVAGNKGCGMFPCKQRGRCFSPELGARVLVCDAGSEDPVKKTVHECRHATPPVGVHKHYQISLDEQVCVSSDILVEAELALKLVQFKAGIEFFSVQIYKIHFVPPGAQIFLYGSRECMVQAVLFRVADHKQRTHAPYATASQPACQSCVRPVFISLEKFPNGLDANPAYEYFTGEFTRNFVEDPLFQEHPIWYRFQTIKLFHSGLLALTTEVDVLSKGDVLDALKHVIDPEIGMNIVDVGLVYRVEPHEDRIEIDYTLTSPGCPLADVIENDMTETLRRLTGIEKIECNLVWNPPWSLDFMSEEARLELGYPI